MYQRRHGVDIYIDVGAFSQSISVLDINSNFDSSQFSFTPYKEILNQNWKISLVLSSKGKNCKS